MVKSDYTGIYSLSVQSTTEKPAFIYKDSKYWIIFFLSSKESFGILHMK